MFLLFLRLLVKKPTGVERRSIKCSVDTAHAVVLIQNTDVFYSKSLLEKSRRLINKEENRDEMTRFTNYNRITSLL